MRRRDFIALVGSSVAGWPLAARAQQQATTVRRVGFLLPGGERTTAVRGQLDAFRQGLKEYGWAEGQNISVEYRFAEGKRTGFRRSPPRWLDWDWMASWRKARRQSRQQKLLRKRSQSSWRRAPIRLELASSQTSTGRAGT